MGNLKLRHNSRLLFDTLNPNINQSNFWEFDWTDFYEGEVEAIPPNAQSGGLHTLIGSDHASNKQII